MNFSHRRLLRTVALFKLVKATLLIVAGVGMLKLMHADITTVLEHWIAKLGLDPGSRLVNVAVRNALSLGPHRIKEFGIGSFVYAGLFLTEGIGLWRLKRWAEWFTVIITASLVPIEVYEIYRRPTAIKVLVLLVNVAIGVYLVIRIRHESGESPAAERGSSQPSLEPSDS